MGSSGTSLTHDPVVFIRWYSWFRVVPRRSPSVPCGPSWSLVVPRVSGGPLVSISRGPVILNVPDGSLLFTQTPCCARLVTSGGPLGVSHGPYPVPGCPMVPIRSRGAPWSSILAVQCRAVSSTLTCNPVILVVPWSCPMVPWSCGPVVSRSRGPSSVVSQCCPRGTLLE